MPTHSWQVEDDVVTEEHIIPKSVGGSFSTFLCKRCNSQSGYKQTRWLAEYISLAEGGAPFHRDPKRQGARLAANGRQIAGGLRLALDGAIEFIADPKRSNPLDYEAIRREPKADHVEVIFRLNVFNNEQSLRVGFLTAAYLIWFKSFGYSWVFQRALDDVRRQILSPDEEVLPWNFIVDRNARSLVPSVGLARFGESIFPVAFIYDCIVILPRSTMAHPASTLAKDIRIGSLDLSPPISARFQNRCVGPAEFICDDQVVISPDFHAATTIASEPVRLECWPA